MASNKSLGNAPDKLAELAFDPIEALVTQYRMLMAEIKAQEEIRDGTLIRLTGAGKPRVYSVETHMSIIDKAGVIGDRLLRYGYARVNESVDQAPREAPVLNIMLSDGTGKFTLNPKLEEDREPVNKPHGPD